MEVFVNGMFSNLIGAFSLYSIYRQLIDLHVAVLQEGGLKKKIQLMENHHASHAYDQTFQFLVLQVSDRRLYLQALLRNIIWLQL